MRFARTLQGPGQGHRLRIAFQRQPLHRRPAGIAEPENLRGLVEGLAQRIVDGGGKAAVLSHALDAENLAMPARNQQQQVGKGEPRIREAGRKRVAFQMVDRQQRLARRHRERLGAHQPDHHPADQPGAGGGGDGVEVIELHTRLGHYFGDHRRKAFGMGARGDLGYDAAIGRVFGLLTGDRLRDDCPVTAHQRDRGLVAARLDAQNEAPKCCGVRGVRFEAHPASI